jgi:hypothetical protein
MGFRPRRDGRFRKLVALRCRMHWATGVMLTTSALPSAPYIVTMTSKRSARRLQRGATPLHRLQHFLSPTLVLGRLHAEKLDERL